MAGNTARPPGQDAGATGRGGADAETRPVSVLVVDDYGPNRVVLRRILEQAGYVVREAETGEEAVEAAVREPPDAILMDIRLPGIDGWQAIGRIRAGQQDRRRSVIVAITADDAASRTASDAPDLQGADAWIAKPLRRITVLERLAALLPGAPVQAPGPPNSGPEQPALSAAPFEEALDRMDGDWQLLLDQTAWLLRDGPTLVRRLEDAVAAEDAPAAESLAHRLKGLLAGFGCPEGAELAGRLEHLARDNGCLSEGPEIVRRLAARAEELWREARRFLARHRPPDTSSSPRGPKTTHVSYHKEDG